MSKRDGKGGFGEWAKADASVLIGLICVGLFFVASGIVSFWNIRVLDQDTATVTRTHRVIAALDDVLNVVTDAETGQRGFLITGREEYLEPYKSALRALDERLNELTQVIPPGTPAASRLPDMKRHIAAKMAELSLTVTTEREQGFGAARRIVLDDKGKAEMDALRDEIRVTDQEQTDARDAGLAEVAGAYRNSLASALLTCMLGLLLTVSVGKQIRRATDERQREDWVRAGQVVLSEAIFGEQRVDQLAAAALVALTRYMDAQAGAMFIQSGPSYERRATFGLPSDDSLLDAFQAGVGLLGQVAIDQRIYSLDNVPAGYLAIASGFLHGVPKNLQIIPCVADGAVTAIIEVGFVHAPPKLALELLERVRGPIGLAVRTAIDRANLQNLLEETQAQGEELQSQGEELRVNNEELEEQGRALRESQGRLEQQHAELEQTNSQLEKQTQLLEAQRDDLRSIKKELEEKATDLERTSRFKSDFLANMSHELRTPLNSSLILAKLLADNREGNLTAEQVRYASTIQSAGNDLLALISDILDLSKIEAGRMEILIQPVRISEIVGDLFRQFEPVASQKGLAFSVDIDDAVPETIRTDSQRLEQVLRNLLSNAHKFTQTGGVKLAVKPYEASYVDFSVMDTGIGILEEQKELVFEAFRQAEGTTNRRFGGTGLGLSISRELAALLGGRITLESESGKGSTFTLRIPMELGEAVVPLEPIGAAPPIQIVRRSAPAETTKATAEATDDRDNLQPNGRLILAVEDDDRFARILYDLAHEHGFQCLIAATADAAVTLALEYVPSAVLLDVSLPDNSGLSVLDRLKHEDRTRHIPVHVVSGSDYSRTALALGAVGNMLKPVKREELMQAFEMLESRLTQRMRRVLVVEDDPIQQESLKLLLASRDVETVGVGSAAECLEALKSSTFDCMVMDLGLPDRSGFSLLQTLSENETYSFPPVIVYTGRDLSAEEEQQLRRNSLSIIVKGAKSPERLLDEVTLFLHQVVADLPVEKQRLIEKAKHRDAALEKRRILVVEDDIRNVFALTSILEPRGAEVLIARSGREALECLERALADSEKPIDLVLMDIMMPEMDGLTAMREIRKRQEWTRLPIIALTAKAMKNDQETCLEAGANDYIAKPLDVEKLLSLVRVWLPR